MRGGGEVTGLVSKIMPIGERSRRVTVLAREKGKFSCFARGTARQGNPLIGIARLSVYGKFMLRSSRDADIITVAEGLRFFEMLKADALAPCYASYFLEPADYFYRKLQREEEGLKLLYSALLALEKPEFPRGLVRHALELKLLVLDGSYVIMPPLEIHKNRACTWDCVVRTLMGKLFAFIVGETALREFTASMDALRSRVASHYFRALSMSEEVRQVQ